MNFIPALISVALIATGCATIQPAPDVEPPDTQPTDAWARVLERFVNDRGRVDFYGLQRDHADLDRYVAWVYAVGPNNRPELFPSREDKLSFHLNAYNALAMWKVLKAGIPEELGPWRRFSFFWRERIKVGGKRMSLYAYENEVIRRLNEPRIHFGLNCMARGCPRLPREPFRAPMLDKQLEREARQFFSEQRNLRVNHGEGTVYTSEILGWFEKDFLAHARSLIAYINRYARQSVPENYSLNFIPYDWRVAHQ